MFKLLLFTIALMVQTVVFAQTSQEKEVATAVEKLRSAMITADKKQLEAIAHDKLSYGHSGGKVEDKKSFVDAFVSGKSKFIDITLSEQTITIVDKTAIVRHKLFANTNDPGKGPSTVNLSILTVWVNEKGKWILLARQAVKV